ncbi:PTS glucose transporter subunit IIA [Rhodococcus sp. Leaf7]|uniref:PTS sugar transporter subunit IIA n=1 Tax=unclassified Rhodococcus (in: high G+C Gram-positive bacteria) TaxID=192944 RepID=UPI0006F4E222|nr:MULTISPECIES: PTS glucose transporter subunit IIA [unclassified Rhodococcus (in: high G+C Gram-positive bacteria)]KQU03745.1 PTS glucose transporter subunit IIA [Rhodococcus sp. Leaf7]KQU39931.1 PTS glucose transporter subunit IIA [Rhodococcus sp. Leaf247]
MTETAVGSPLAGTVISLADVPDPVFSSQMVGAGVAVRPAPATGMIDVHSPVSGRILKLHPHAFVVMTADKRGVLVHVGIDTVKMKGVGFELVAAEKDTVTAGDVVVRYDPAAVAAAGYDDVCPVVLMDSPADSIVTSSVGESVAVGDTLYAL